MGAALRLLVTQSGHRASEDGGPTLQGFSSSSTVAALVAAMLQELQTKFI